jgi:hypothetical protein
MARRSRQALRLRDEHATTMDSGHQQQQKGRRAKRLCNPETLLHGGSSGWNGKKPVDTSVAQTLSKGAAVVMLQEVSLRPGERRRIKSTLKALGQEYWCVMEASHRVRAGRELLKVGMSNRNYNAPWVYSVVTFVHKDVVKRPIRMDWAGQYTNKSMKHMLQGLMLWLWAPSHSEPQMLLVNIHQAGSADADIQQRVLLAMQAMRARYPEAQGIVGGDSSTLMPMDSGRLLTR